MNKLLILAVITLSCVCLVRTDEASDLALNKQKLTEAKQILEQVKTKVESSYIINFTAMLMKGVTDLEKNTEEELKKETNLASRHQIIEFSTKAYDRLIKFIKEVEENLTNTKSTQGL